MRPAARIGADIVDAGIAVQQAHRTAAEGGLHAVKQSLDLACQSAVDEFRLDASRDVLAQAYIDVGWEVLVHTARLHRLVVHNVDQPATARLHGMRSSHRGSHRPDDIGIVVEQRIAEITQRRASGQFDNRQIERCAAALKAHQMNLGRQAIRASFGQPALGPVVQQ